MSTDTEFVRGNDLATAWRHLAPAKSSVSLAVAYWGDGAADLLGLNRLGSVRIICNLQSGACNRNVVEQLVLDSRVGLRTIDNLHAKVYIAQKGVIIGSSNCSHNGMPVLTGTNMVIDVCGMIEANVMLRTPQHRNELLIWFENIWEKSQVVTQANLDNFPFLQNGEFLSKHNIHIEQEGAPAVRQIMSFVDRFTNQRITAYGAPLDDGRYVVFAKSQARGSTLAAWNNDKAVAPLNRAKRENLIDSKILIQRGTHFEFTQHVIFDSGHQASVVIRASAANKNVVWRFVNT
jgi:hypothetical protein